MTLSKFLAIALTGASLIVSACSPSSSGNGGGNTGGSEDSGGSTGKGGSGSGGNSSGGDTGSSAASGGNTSTSSSASGGATGSGGSGGSSSQAGSSASGGSTGTTTTTAASGGSTGSGGTTSTGTSTNKCPGTPIVIDWANGWMDAALNPAIHGAWYTYGDTNGTTFTPGKGAKVTTNCITGTIAAAGWGAGFGFNVNQLAGSTAKSVWAKPPAKICFDLEITGAVAYVELPMTKADVHAPPYGKRIVTGVNEIDLATVNPTWIDPTKLPGTWDAADVAEIHLKLGKPGTDFKLCVNGMSVQ